MVGVWPSHPEGSGSHFLPAMASLAGEVTQLLHLPILNNGTPATDADVVVGELQIVSKRATNLG